MTFKLYDIIPFLFLGESTVNRFYQDRLDPPDGVDLCAFTFIEYSITIRNLRDLKYF